MAKPSRSLSALIKFAQEKLGEGQEADLVRTAVYEYAVEKYIDFLRPKKMIGDPEKLWREIQSHLSERPSTEASLGQPVDHGSQPPGAEPSVQPVAAAQGQPIPALLLTAPFRFVPLSEKVSVRAQGDTSADAPLDRPQQGHLSASIQVEWEVETPLLIGEAKSKSANAPLVPFQLSSQPSDQNPVYAIPGATLRGATRSTVEILAFARLFQANQHVRYGFRDFFHDLYIARLLKAGTTNNLQAGWLTRNDDGDAEITPCDRWGLVEIADLIWSSEREDLEGWVKSDRSGKHRTLATGRGIIVAWSGPNAHRQEVDVVEAPSSDQLFPQTLYQIGSGGISGHLVVSGAVPAGNDQSKSNTKQKKFEYVFFDNHSQKAAKLSKNRWNTFLTSHSKQAKNRLLPDGAWEDLEPTFRQGGRIPVFYIGNLDDPDDENFAFGLTRLFRLPHAHSIGDLIRHWGPEHSPTRRWGENEAPVLAPDFVESLFGYVYEPAEAGLDGRTPPHELAKKGRVAFGFAKPVDAGQFHLWPEKGAVETVLGAPKPQFAPFYLEGPEHDYSAVPRQGDLPGTQYPRIAGRKRYIVRRKIGTAESEGLADMETVMKDQAEKVRRVSSKGLANVSSHLRFLRPEEGAAFKGEIRFHNVSPAEFGAVLWALTFGGETNGGTPRRHLLGHAKPFGAGQVFVRKIDGTIRWNDQAKPREKVDWRAAGGRAGIETFLAAFEREIARLAGFGEEPESMAAWRTSPPVAGLLSMAEPRGWTAPRTRYLDYIDAQGKQAGDFQKLKQLTLKGGPNTLLPP